MKPTYVASLAVAAAALLAVGFVGGRSHSNNGLSGAAAPSAPSATTRTTGPAGKASEKSERAAPMAGTAGAARNAATGADPGGLGARNDSPASRGAQAVADHQARGDLADAEILASPEFQKLLGEQVKARVAARYAEFFHRAHLPADKASAVQQLLQERQTAYVDAAQAAREKGLADAEVAGFAGQYARQTQKDVMLKLKEALGKDGYEQLLYFERTQPERETVMQLARRLNHGEAPLAGQQQQQLVDILAADAAANAAKGSARAGASPEKLSRQATNLLGSYGLSAQTPVTISEASIVRAAAFLNPTQMTALQQMQAEQRRQAELLQMLGRTNGQRTPGQ